ncbi:MAG: type III-B CRISPR module RAMP protein Cmr1 [Geminicoccaceae bacterium]
MTARTAPTIAELPPRRARATPAGPTREKLELPLRIVTPVLGGAAVPRTIDEVDVVRVPSIRGQLRFWWRALHAHLHPTPRALHEAESALFGRAADEGGGRSAVDVRISGVTAGSVDRTEVRLYGAQATPGAYAVFPARAEAGGTPTAPRRSPGTRFTLELLAPTDRLEELQHVVRAWILFGGYGSRTRRGLGSLTVEGAERSRWLPNEATCAEFTRLFGRDPFAAAGPPSETPRLAGASLLVGEPVAQAEQAWTTALHWLRDFRQGTETGARNPGGNNRPSISNWPEADKIRHLTGKTRSHPPRHGPDPAWPRAAFGLPIVGQFQTAARGGGRYDEPGPFELTWRDADGLHNRLASPLIVKAMPLATGKFVPIALWLERAWPAGGEVVLRMGGKEVANSAAPFDKLLGKGDRAYFQALTGKTSLREAFLDWLAGRGIRRIAG